MEEYGGGDLLSEAMGSAARVVVVEDCVEAPGAFVLHLLLKRALAGGGAAAFLALAQPFTHYDRILRKMGCNLSLHRRNERLHFFELQAFPGKQSFYYLMLFPDIIGSGAKDGAIADCFVRLYSEIQRVVEATRTGENAGQFTIMIDDVSLLEVAAHGSVDNVLDFLYYCVTLTSEMNCSLVILIHEDIYAVEENMGLLLHLRHIADLVVKAAPLSTGLAADVHGQLSVVNKGTFSEQRAKAQKVWSFHFKVKENSTDFFYPGSTMSKVSLNLFFTNLLAFKHSPQPSPLNFT
ncbi:elongator complex protein 6 [Panicum miliaceum]|uniref:Elongator complex protein 6 n=1 Tax=Panicum miliaceum TaxID=4540 RepID=A0A3L6SBZ1_PANMI|nr:elongator complex protein 6 [Panicum miliaceum]